MYYISLCFIHLFLGTPEEKALSYSGKDVQISIEEDSRYETGSRLSVTWNKEKVEIPSPFSDISTKRIYDDSLVLIGSRNSRTYCVTILSLKTKKIVSTFHCRYPSISPNGRYIIFIKPQPDLFAPDRSNYSDVFLIYDVSLSRDQNKMLVATDPHKLNDIGISFYPLDNFDKRSYEFIEKYQVELLYGPAVWSIDGSKFLCLVVLAENHMSVYHLIEGKILDDQSIHLKKINLNLNSKKGTKKGNEIELKQEASFYPLDVSFHKDDTILVKGLHANNEDGDMFHDFLFSTDDYINYWILNIQ